MDNCRIFLNWTSTPTHCPTIVLPAKVIVPLLASARPSKVAPVLKLMDCMAITVPLKTDVVPNVAELPTCQKILEAWAEPARITFLPDVVVSEDAIWMMNTASASPCASNVKSPDEMAREDVDL